MSAGAPGAKDQFAPTGCRVAVSRFRSGNVVFLVMEIEYA